MKKTLAAAAARPPKVMTVKKRNGSREDVDFNKVLFRLRKLAVGLDVDADELAKKVIDRIFDGVETERLDDLAAQICSSRIADHPHWNALASRILVDNHHKRTSPSFSETVERLHKHTDVHGLPCPLVSQKLHDVTMKNQNKINKHIKYDRDHLLDYFGIATLLNGSYLMRIDGRVIERPAHMFMRVALGIHGDDIKAALETYDLMSTKRMIHASPTLFSAGSPTPQLSSCFVAGTRVYTLNAGVKAVEDVVVGDVVVTHLGNAKPVAQTHAFPLNGRALFDFKVFKGPTITATEDHPFMSLTAEQEGWGQAPQWNKLGTLRVGDFIEIPRFEPSALVAPTFDVEAMVPECKDGREPGVKRVWRLADLPFCQLLGEWAGHGTELVKLTIDGNAEKRAFLEAAGKAFGDVDVDVDAEDALVFKSPLVHRVLVAAFGERGAMRLPAQAHTWHTAMVQAFLLGFGPVLDPKTSEYPADERALRADVFNLARSRGLVHHDKWATAVMKTVGGRTFLRIEAKAPSARTDSTVYTLGVEDDHSFAVDGVIAKNCYLVASKGDSIDAIFSTIKEMALISKYAGGIGVHISNIRAKGSKIRGTNGVADGIVPMLRLFNDTALYVNQGGGKRPGAIAVYLEPWHADTLAFIQLRKTTGDMKQRCLDLFLALWCPSLLVRRVEADAAWSLMCPDECPGLADVWGPEFDALYERYEAEGRAKSTMPAREMWRAICLAQAETGVPYLLYKDHANAKSNQQNLGTIKSSNLCVAPETMLLTDKGYFNIKELATVGYGDGPGEVAVWNGKVFSATNVVQTGTQQPLLTVSFDNGVELRCTPYHKFYIVSAGSKGSDIDVDVVEAKDLTVGMRLKRFEVPIINLPAPEEPLKYAYTQGLFAAEGTYQKFSDEEKHRCPYQQSEDDYFCKRHTNNVAVYDDDGQLRSGEPQCRAESYTDKPLLWLYGVKKTLLDHVEFLYANNNEACDRLDVALPHDMKPKFFVPINHDIATKLRWLEGYTDGDGCVLENNGIKNVQVASTEKAFVLDVMYMLQTLGVKIAIKKARDAGMRSMPDGRGGHKDYMCAAVWRFNIDAKSVIHLVGLGYAPKRLKLGTLRAPFAKNNRYTRVSGVVDKGEVADTFCFNEPLENSGVFSGVLTKQCCEVVQASSPDETAVCLAGDTLVVTERRGAVRIDAVAPGDRVLAVFEDDKHFAQNQRFVTATLIDNGERDVVAVSLRNGASIKATADHRFLVHTFEGGYAWRAAGKLRPGEDALIVPLATAMAGYADVLAADVTAAIETGDADDAGSAAHAFRVASAAAEADADAKTTYASAFRAALGTARKNLTRSAGWQPCDPKGSAVGIASAFAATLAPALDAAFAAAPVAAAAFLRGLFSSVAPNVDDEEGEVELSFLLPTGGEAVLARVAEVLRRFGIDAAYEVVQGDDDYVGSETLTMRGGECLVALRDRLGVAGLDEAISAATEDDDDPYAAHGVRAVPVRAVTAAGRERVYDLSVIDARHFVANGVVAHNCNLASLALPSYLTRDPATGHATGFDFADLARVAGIATRNLNKVIDINFYPVETAQRSNTRHRPVGLGVQGLANVFAALRMPYDSPEAAALNRKIFATIYYGALDASCALAERGGAYETWPGSPGSKGRLQYDMWGVEPESVNGTLDWAALKARIALHGLRNSLLVAPMPTASTSNILGCVESFEPYTSMAFTRRTLAGEFTIMCRELVDALIERGLWDKAMKEAILRDDGSVQANARVPEDLRAVFKTAWEIKQRDMIDMAADRGAYICQSASQNMFIADAGTNLDKLYNAHLYAHAKGLKTACYYLRTKPKGKIQAFTLAPDGPAAPAASAGEPEPEVRSCSRDNPNCESCSG